MRDLMSGEQGKFIACEASYCTVGKFDSSRLAPTVHRVSPSDGEFRQAWPFAAIDVVGSAIWQSRSGHTLGNCSMIKG
jgi:hypothetical protein